jgi:predicted dehydrogenase
MARKLAIIGLGMGIAPHAKGLLDLAGRAEVVCAVSRTEARCRAFAERFPFPTTTDVDAAIADPRTEAVLIATPPATHLDLVRRAAAAGKHVLLEKPIEIDTARSHALVEAAAQAGITLGMVLQFRFRETSRRLRALLDAGALGEVACANVAVPWWRPQAYYDEPGRGTAARDGGGVLITQAIHTLDLFQSLVGGVREVAAVAATTRAHRMECEDFAAAGLVLGNGAPGALLATTAAFPGAPERVELFGTAASAVLAGDALAIHHRDGSTETFGGSAGTPGSSPGAGGADPMDFPHDAHRAVMTDFLDALDEGRAPAVSGAEALKVHRLIDALLESAAGGRRVTVAAS